MHVIIFEKISFLYRIERLIQLSVWPENQRSWVQTPSKLNTRCLFKRYIQSKKLGAKKKKIRVIASASHFFFFVVSYQFYVDTFFNFYENLVHHNFFIVSLNLV